MKRLPDLPGLGSLDFRDAEGLSRLLTERYYSSVSLAKWLRGKTKDYNEEVPACAKISLCLLAHVMSLTALCMYIHIKDGRGSNDQHEILYEEYEDTSSKAGNAKLVDYLVKGMERYLQKFPMPPPRSKPETSPAATRRSVGAAAGAGGGDDDDDCIKYALDDFDEA